MPVRKKHLSPTFSGAIDKTIVVKQYATKTVITAYPDMSKVQPSPGQKYRRTVFTEAVAYAKQINNDPQLRAAYAARIPKGKSVFHAALSHYLQMKKA